MSTFDSSSAKDQQENKFPHCNKLHMVGGLVECGEHPKSCEWFLSYGNSGFCMHPEVKQWVKE